MAANSQTIDDINKMADDMVAKNHGQTKYVQKRRAEINNKSVTCFYLNIYSYSKLISCFWQFNDYVILPDHIPLVWLGLW